MATITVKRELVENINEWAAAAAPILARDPAFIGRLGVSSMQGFIDKLTRLIDKFDDFTTTNIVNNELKAATAAINQTFGTTLSAPQFQAAPVTPLSTSPPLTPTQAATLGTGVELSEIDPALLEAAAVLAPESAVARFVAARDTPVPDAASPAPPVDFVPTSLVSSQAEGIAEPQTFAEIGIRSRAAPTPDTMVPDFPINERSFMPNGQDFRFRTFDPSVFRPSTFNPLHASDTTGLPTSGGPSEGLIDVSDAIRGGVEVLLAGGNILDILKGATLGGLGISTPRGTPTAFTSPENLTAQINLVATERPDQLRAFLQALVDSGVMTLETMAAILARLGTAVVGTPETTPLPTPALPMPGAVQIPLNGALATTGLPIAPVVAAMATTCYRAPKGYVVVEIVSSSGLPMKVSMWKPLARSMKLFKSRPKAKITASEWRTLRVAERVSKKAKAVAQAAGFSVSVSGKARPRPKKVC